MKRTLAIILSLVLLFSVLPLTAYAAEADAAETGSDELTITKAPENAFILYSSFAGGKVYPYLRFGVSGGTGNYTYEWYYDLNDEYAIGELIATTTKPELQVDKVGWYRCWVRDTNGHSQITKSVLVKESNDYYRYNMEFRIDGTTVRWKESLFENEAHFTLTKHDKTHNTYDYSHFYIVRNKSTNSVTLYNEDSYGRRVETDYPVEYQNNIFSFDLRDKIKDFASYDDIEFSLRKYGRYDSYRETRLYPVKSLYNGEVYHPTPDEYLHEGEAQILEKDYYSGDTMIANLNGGRFAGYNTSSAEITWQKYENSAWKNIKTGSFGYTLVNADVGNRIRFIVKPKAKGIINGEIYYDDEYLVSNEIWVSRKKINLSGAVNCSFVTPEDQVRVSEDITFTDDYNGKYFELDTYSGTGLSWYCTTDDRFLTTDETFVGGKTYRATVVFKLKDTNLYEYSYNNIKIYFNGLEATLDTDYFKAQLRYTPAASNKCTVTFDKNGGTGNMAPVKVNKGSSYKLPECGFTHPNGNQFKNWKIGSYVYNPGDTVTINSNTTVYAQWKGKYTITYDRNGGTGTMAAETYNEGDKYVIPACRFTPPSNMIFGGWLVDGKPDSVGDYWNVYSNHTLTPQWIPSSGIAERVDITVTAPKADEMPSYDVTVYGSGNVITGNEVPVSGSPGVYTQYKGVLWRDMTTRKNHRSNAAFVDGHEYRVSVDLKSLVGTTFNFEDESKPITQIYINGSAAEIQPAAMDNNICTAMYTFTKDSTVSGTETSYLSDTDTVTIQLLQSDTVKYSTTTTGNTASYSITGVASGSYTLRVSKNNHVTRDYTVNVSGNTTQDVKINPIGDVDGNGKVQANDAMQAYQHAQGKANAQLSGYALDCADVAPVGDPNGKVQAADAMVIYQQAQGKHPLF